MSILFLLLFLYIAWLLYKVLYYKGASFNNLKNDIASYVQECNEFNDHITALKDIDLSYQATDYGSMTHTNNNIGQYTYKRKTVNFYSDRTNVYECSLQVFKNSTTQPYKYICKYFNIPINEDTLNHFETLLNNFSAVEQGKHLLVEKKAEIMQGIDSQIPVLIKKFDRNNLESKLNFEMIDLSDAYYPRYTFRYMSAGGKSGKESTIVFNLETLESFVRFLSEKVKFKKSSQGQRQLMTRHLREHIKERDNYTCRFCGVSVNDEPHLLLEIDHIIPIAKGGLTEDSNLQTLCWKCNRTKGSKIVN